MRRGLASTLSLLLACASEPQPTASDEVQTAPAADTSAPAPRNDSEVPAKATPADGCAQLREHGREDATDAGLFVLLCPELVPNARELRSALLLTDRLDAGEELLNRPSEASPAETAELRALVRLATTPPTRFAPAIEDYPFPRADDAVLTPLSEDTLTMLAQASRRLSEGGLAPDLRLDARGLLARAYLDAIRALGLDPSRPLPPLSRRLAGPALAHSLALCRGYWRRGGRRLNGRAKEIEMVLLELVRAVDRTPPHELDALLTDAHHQAWRYLQQRDVRRRVAAQLAKREKRAMGFESPSALHGVESLAPFPRQLERLVIAGLPDLALEEALRMARDKKAFGVEPVEAQLLALLGAHGFGATEEKAREAFDRLRRERHAPPELGPVPYEADTPSLWTPLPELRAQFDARVTESRSLTGVQRAHALARASLLLRGRPDLRVALEASASQLPPELSAELLRPKVDDPDTKTRRALAIESASR